MPTFCPGPPQECWQANCGPGEVCVPGRICSPQAYCVRDCTDPTAKPCGEGYRCGSSKVCEAIRCDDADYPGCPTGMGCDPAAAADAEPGRYRPVGAEVNGKRWDGNVSAAQTQAAKTGCVFLHCDQSGAFDCAEGYACDVATADPTTTGCLALPCSSFGGCSDAAFICEPTSSMSRPAGVDPHGCVRRNCDEGLACPLYTRCDFTRMGDGTGCAYLMCDEPGGGCWDGYKCDPDPKPLPSGKTPEPTGTGCIPEHCSIDGAACVGAATECRPEDPESGVNGCAVPKPVATGGGPSSGGTGTAGAAETGVGGSTGGSGGAPATGGAAQLPPEGACETDADCDLGYCVQGRCAGSLGVCQ